MPELTPKGRAFASLMTEIFLAKTRTLQGAERVAQSAGLTAARWQILAALEHDPAPVAHVARRLGLTRQSVQQTANSMAREGFLAFRANPHHSRAQLLAITGRARVALDALRPREIEFANLMGRRYSLDALRTAVDVLRQTREAIEAGMPGEPG
jgi:DNA-binding MarR family transcriptional regulator